MVNQTLLHSLLVVVLLSTTIYATKISSGLILEMIHRDSPKSPLYRANLTNNERMKMYIEMSTARVKSFRRSRVTSLSPNEGIIRPKLILTQQFSTYLVQVGIGTFIGEFPTSKPYYMVLDTGSQLTWTQCEGCTNCFLHGDPPFPAAQSASYQQVSCKDCPPGSICKSGVCVIQIEYFDKSKVTAIVAKEDFTFVSQGESSHRINNIVFGCGFHMENFHEDKFVNNKISGIMGMSNGYYGFMQQTQIELNGMFSYCLQPTYRPGGSPMYLRFGYDAVPQPGLPLQATPIYKYNDQGLYYLNLQGISVDTKRLPINPDIFKRKNDGTGGCVIDSGTPTSGIPTKAYAIFKEAVISFMLDHNKGNWKRLYTRHPELIYFDLCYRRYRLKSIVLPKITFHFENDANFVIGGEESFTQTMTVNHRLTIVCMQIFESTSVDTGSITYLGGILQANQRIVYDLVRSILYFAPDDCSNEN